MALLSTFSDDFSGADLDPALWTVSTPGNITDGSLVLVQGRTVESVATYTFDRMYFRLEVLPGKLAYILVDDPVAGEYFAMFRKSATTGLAYAEWQFDGESASHAWDLSDPPGDPETWFQIRQVVDPAGRKVLVFEVTTDAKAAENPQPQYWPYGSPTNTSNWRTIAITSNGIRSVELGTVRVRILGSTGVKVTEFNTGIVDPPALPPSPLDSPPYDVDGDAYVPEDAAAVDAECATVLELIQEFSSATRRAVRITGSSSIAMVDPVAPLPTGWTQADADAVYHSTVLNLAAGSKELSMLAGDLALTGSASLVVDDVRLLVSDWQIPNRLPVYGLHPAPVQRVTYTFSPKAFSASVEFAFRTVPLEVRRT